jgi:hypothetical protein
MAKKSEDWVDDVERREKAIKKHWRDDADKIVGIYEADEKERVPFNILYSNTETLLPALYNSTPRPEITRRFTTFGPEKSMDVALQNVGERVLEYTADSNVQEYQTFDEATRDAVLAALVPGQGVARVRHHEKGGFQEICFESVPYDNFVWAYARKWQDVAWVAFAYDLIKPDFEAQFPDFAKTAKYRSYKWEKDDGETTPEDAERRESAGTAKQACIRVWEIWDANTKEIKFVSDAFKETYLREVPYPFELTSRFPMPRPLQFVKRVDNLMPVPPYQLYESQARELNELTRRLKLVVKAIKVRGGYNAQMTEIANILKSDDTELIPIENASIMGETGGFDKHIWFMPLAELMAVAKELYAAREQVKATIYEIMGIGDILRGASVASETAKAQEIKNQWGSLRVKRMQKDVQVFCRDLFRVAFEFAGNLYAPATLQAITKMPYLLNAQKQQFQQQMQMQAMQPPQMGPDGQPQPPPQPPPEMQMLMAAPSWEDISAKLRDQYERTYRIDVETNSTVDLEATEDKAQIGEFMNAFGQMMSGLQPMVESGAMPFEAAKLVMGETFRRFRFARRVEQALDMIQAPPPKEDDKVKDEKHKNELMKVQAEAKRQVGEMQESMIEATGEIERLRIQNEELKAGQNILTASSDLERKGMEVQGRMTEHQMKTDYQGKMQMRDQQMAQKEQSFAQQQAQLKDQMLQDQIGQMFQQHQSQMEQMMQQMSQVMQERDTVEAAKEEKPDTEDQLLQQIAESQKMLLEGLAQLVQVVSAERETEVVVGADGRKRGRSRIVLQ